ncbi:hypothetical protein LAJ19_20390 (plasmid) [Deinococcus taeanensis]|uniref:hypothetical protein n=1 Tax=Deinococcus taeanensis TaxID=2737050 RepID=UPI001CDC0CAD|nr:hypothetical protein [Deinococcus taeanensis]UBV45173.1 hypothetical protein LAJ19_20390 [Deinococcus taeanensis]
MSPRRRLPPVPQYRGDARPAHLLTTEELAALHLKPARATPDAVWLYERGQVSGMSALFDRTAAVPADQPPT